MKKTHLWSVEPIKLDEGDRECATAAQGLRVRGLAVHGFVLTALGRSILPPMFARAIGWGGRILIFGCVSAGVGIAPCGLTFLSPNVALELGQRLAVLRLVGASVAAGGGVADPLIHCPAIGLGLLVLEPTAIACAMRIEVSIVDPAGMLATGVIRNRRWTTCQASIIRAPGLPLAILAIWPGIIALGTVRFAPVLVGLQRHEAKVGRFSL